MTLDINAVAERLLLELGKESDILKHRAEGVRLLYSAILKEAETLRNKASESSESETNN